MPTDICNEFKSIVSVNSIIAIQRLDLRKRRMVGELCNHAEIYYVEQGATEMFSDGSRFTLNEGSMIIYGPGTFRGKSPYYIPGGIVNVISFDVDSSIISSLYNFPIRLNSRQRSRLEKIVAIGQLLLQPLKDSCNVVKMQLREDSDPRDIQQLKNRMELFILDISYMEDRKKSPGYRAGQEKLDLQQMDQLTEYLLNHLNQNPSIKDMQSALWISESTLRRLVHRCKGCGPIAYYQELRIREAKELIQNTSLSMTEIANRLGFYSLAYFSRLFRIKTGITPTEYARTEKK